MKVSDHKIPGHNDLRFIFSLNGNHTIPDSLFLESGKLDINQLSEKVDMLVSQLRKVSDLHTDLLEQTPVRTSDIEMFPDSHVYLFQKTWPLGYVLGAPHCSRGGQDYIGLNVDMLKPDVNKRDSDKRMRYGNEPVDPVPQKELSDSPQMVSPEGTLQRVLTHEYYHVLQKTLGISSTRTLDLEMFAEMMTVLANFDIRNAGALEASLDWLREEFIGGYSQMDYSVAGGYTAWPFVIRALSSAGLSSATDILNAIYNYYKKLGACPTYTGNEKDMAFRQIVESNNNSSLPYPLEILGVARESLTRSNEDTPNPPELTDYDNLSDYIIDWLGYEINRLPNLPINIFGESDNERIYLGEFYQFYPVRFSLADIRQKSRYPTGIQFYKPQNSTEIGEMIFVMRTKEGNVIVLKSDEKGYIDLTGQNLTSLPDVTGLIVSPHGNRMKASLALNSHKQFLPILGA